MINSAERTLNVTDFAAGEDLHNVQEIDTLLTTPNVSPELILDLTAASATDTVRRHLVTRRNMECFQGLAILVVVCTVITVIICALQTLCFFLLKRTKNVPLSRINEDLNGHNREPGNPREINIQWPHLNRRKQPIEHSEQPFNQVGFMIIA